MNLYRFAESALIDPERLRQLLAMIGTELTAREWQQAFILLHASGRYGAECVIAVIVRRIMMQDVVTFNYVADGILPA